MQADSDQPSPTTRRELRERLAAQLRSQNTGPVDLGEAGPELSTTGASPSGGAEAATEAARRATQDAAVQESSARAAGATDAGVTDAASRPAPRYHPEREHPHDTVAAIFNETITDDKPAPRARRRGTGARGWIALIVALAIVGLGVYGAWQVVGDKVLAFLHPESTDYEGSGNGETIQFSIRGGDTGTSIGERLEQQGIVKTAKSFITAIQAKPEEPKFFPGVYGMQKEMSAESALTILTDVNQRIANTLLITEGMIAKDVYQAISDSLGIPLEEVQEAAKDPQAYGLPKQAKTLEGFLFPATYEFEPGVDAKTVLQTLVNRTEQALRDAKVPEDQVWDIIRMASLVEKEARIESDFPKVARVFYNRLDQGMLFQSDATVTYGTGHYERVTTTDAERADASNPYNTYQHEGLPVGPISNPGDIAINAAMHPADGTWLYFVAVNLETGETRFANTLEEHEQNSALLQQWLREHPDFG